MSSPAVGSAFRIAPLVTCLECGKRLPNGRIYHCSDKCQKLRKKNWRRSYEADPFVKLHLRDTKRKFREGRKPPKKPEIERRFPNREEIVTGDEYELKGFRLFTRAINSCITECK